MTDTDFTDVSAPRLNGFAVVQDYTRNGWKLTAWREGAGRFFVELAGERIFRFAAPSLFQAEEALLARLEAA